MAQNLQQLGDGSAAFVNDLGIKTMEIGAGRGSVGTTSGISHQSTIDSVVRQTIVKLTGVAVTITDAGTAGAHGSVKVYTCPAGLIGVMGATASVTIAESGGINNTGAVLASLGTAAVGTNNATLTSTEANIIPSTSCTLTSAAGTFSGKSTTTELALGLFDGTSSVVEFYLNFAVADASSTANATLTLNGTVTITWVNHGDI